jgi:hypothetical protein
MTLADLMMPDRKRGCKPGYKGLVWALCVQSDTEGGSCLSPSGGLD